MNNATHAGKNEWTWKGVAEPSVTEQKMNRRGVFKPILSVVAVTGLLSLSACDSGPDASPATTADAEGDKTMSTISIASPAFEDGQPIPEVYSQDGKNVSPPLEWSGVPDNAKELVLIVDDPDAPMDKPYVHWVIR